MRSRAHTGNSCLKPVKARSGFPVGVLVLIVALPLFVVLWLRGKLHE